MGLIRFNRKLDKKIENQFWTAFIYFFYLYVKMFYYMLELVDQTKNYFTKSSTEKKVQEKVLLHYLSTFSSPLPVCSAEHPSLIIFFFVIQNHVFVVCIFFITLYTEEEKWK